MFSDLDRFLEDLFSRILAERPADLDPWFFDYFRELSGPAGCRRYARALLADLDLAGFRPEGKVVVDAGSGFGVTLLAFAHLGARPAIGIEAFRPMAVTSSRVRSRWAGGLPAFVVRGSVHEAPLRAGSVDFIYCNEAISHFRRPDEFLREAARLLKSGGRLMICDGNNALNPRTVRRVRDIWRHFEQGPPVADIHGHRVDRPYRGRRKEMIAAVNPGLPDEKLEKLAWGTFGLHGEAVLTRAREILETGAWPEAPPRVDSSPVDPEKGDFIENLVDARRIAAALVPLGLRPRVHAHFAGARSPVLAGVNRVLRALTPVSISWARSVKIVATKV